MTTITNAMHIATQLQNEGKCDEAKLILNSILDAEPTHAYALHLSGIIAYKAGDLQLGVQLILKAIENKEDVAMFHANLGEMYRQLKDIPTSILWGKKAIALDPSSEIALSNLGIAFYDAKHYEEAATCHKRALAINPRLSTSLNNMGSIYKIKGNLPQAIAFYQAAMKLNFVEAYHNLGILYLEQQQYNEAADYIEKVLQLKPHDIKTYLLLAEIYQEQGNHKKALMVLDKALSIDPSVANLYISKGNVLMEMGEISSAEEQFLKIVEDSDVDTRILSLYCLIQLQKSTPNHPHFKSLLSLAHNIEKISLDKQEYVYYALGKCYDDIGEWEKSFKYFKQGSELKRKRISYDSHEQTELTDKIIHAFTKEAIEHLRTFAHPTTLPIFIIGMPRGGTTLVEQIISSHPDVYGAGELPFLNNILNQKRPYPDLLSHDFHDMADKYLSYVNAISDDAIRITDKMPQNFMAAGIIHALFPHAKIIHVKRNPLDTCLSCYTKLFSKGHEYSYDLEELGKYYLCYEKIMKHWRHILPPHAWLEINYEDIIHHLERETKRLIAYCDLTWNPNCLEFYHSKRNVRTASFMQVRQPVYASSLNRWRRFKKELAPLISILAHH